MTTQSLKPLILVTTTFYPHAVVGSVRAANWARMLPDLGWKPIVLCRWYSATATRALLDQNVHTACEVIYLDGPWANLTQAERDAAMASAPPTPAPAPSTSHPPTLITRLKRSLGSSGLTRFGLVPDPSVVFWRRVAPKVREFIASTGARLLLSCSPPHSTHLVGFGVTNVPWALDFQDPYMMDVRYRPQGLSGLITRSRHIAFKQRCMENGAAIIQANAVHERWVRLRFPVARRRCHLLAPVCPRDILAGHLTPDPAPEGTRSIRVVGFIGQEESVLLARAVRALCDRSPATRLELRFVGRPPTTADQIREILGDRVVFTGPLVHEQAKRQILGADLLVSYLSPYRASYHGISSKLYEFVPARKPIIHINPTSPDRDLLRRMSFVQVMRDPPTDVLAAAIERGLSPQSAQLARTAPEVDDFIARNSWERHATHLGEVLAAAEREWQARHPAAAP